MNTGSVEGCTDWYSVVLGQNRALLVASMMSFQKIYGLHGLNHQIIEYMEKEKVITDKQINKSTDRISPCRLDPFCGRGRVKITKSLKIDKSEVKTLDSLKVQCDIEDFKPLQNVCRVQTSDGLFHSMLSDHKPVIICCYFHYFTEN